MNLTIKQLNREYKKKLKEHFENPTNFPPLFEEQEAVEDYISKAENLKTLVSLYGDLSRIYNK